MESTHNATLTAADARRIGENAKITNEDIYTMLKGIISVLAQEQKHEFVIDKKYWLENTDDATLYFVRRFTEDGFTVVLKKSWFWGNSIKVTW